MNNLFCNQTVYISRESAIKELKKVFSKINTLNDKELSNALNCFYGEKFKYDFVIATPAQFNSLDDYYNLFEEGMLG